MLIDLRKEDSVRVAVAANKILEKGRMNRRKLCASKKRKADSVAVTYCAGSFGLGTEGEDVTKLQTDEVKKKSAKASTRNTKDDALTFPSETDNATNNTIDVGITFVDDTDIP